MEKLCRQGPKRLLFGQSSIFVCGDPTSMPLSHCPSLAPFLISSHFLFLPLYLKSSSCFNFHPGLPDVRCPVYPRQSPEGTYSISLTQKEGGVLHMFRASAPVICAFFMSFLGYF